jgi:hypothetical protein
MTNQGAPAPAATAAPTPAPGAGNQRTAFAPAATASTVAAVPASEIASVPGAPGHASAPTCANCGQPVGGHFCSNCGQRVEHAVHSVWHFASEAVEDLTHADSRLWSTVGALLFKPGYLTCEFLAGRRVKYLPPLRLYLVLSLLFFVVTAYDSNKGDLMVLTIGQGSGHALALQPMPRGTDVQRRQYAQDFCSKLEPVTPWRDFLRKGCLKAVEDDARSLRETYLHGLPRAIFLSLPLLAIVMKPLYLRPRRYYVEHLLFFLHNHAFLFLWFGVLTLLQLLIPVDAVSEALSPLFALYVPYYYFRAMRRVYGDGPARTFGKFTVLSLTYLIVAIALLVANGLYSLLVQGA